MKQEVGNVAVIGGGAIGLACAWKLALRGARVTLFEAGEVGREASWASAGMLAAQVEAARHPVEGEAAREFFELCLRSRELWPDFAQELGDVGLRWGAVYAQTRSDDEALAHLLKGENARSCEFNGFPAARLPLEGRVDNRRALEALKRRAQSIGVQLREGEAAHKVEVSHGRVEIETSRGAFEFDAVLLCAGAWSGRVAGFELPTRPVAGEMLALKHDGLRDVLYGSDVYLVPREVNGEARVLVGATMGERDFDKSLRSDSARQLLNAARTLLPALRDAEIVEHWAGLRPATPDGLPILGRAGENIWTATGHFRNGLLLTPITSELMARAILDGEEVSPAFSPRRSALQTAP